MPKDPPTGAPDDRAADAIGYGDALAELEAILDEIEDDAVDVDVLSTRVRRAAELLRVCRDRITAARVEVEQIVADLDPGLDPAAVDPIAVDPTAGDPTTGDGP